jgi:hypothetical protein
MSMRMRTALAVLSASTSILAPSATAQDRLSDNAFNPAFSVILDGRYGSFSNDPEDYRLPGFQLGDEAGSGEESFHLGESELNASANIDDRFYGWFTAALHSEDGETEVELEEAYLETLGLGAGFTIKAGRFFSEIGYLNPFHVHAWDFVDAPLIYRGLFGDQFNDDGVQIRWVAPTPLYVQLGTELLRGGDFPASRGDEDIGAYTAFVDFGGDFAIGHSWQAGLFYLGADVADRAGGGHAHGEEEEEAGVFFTGDDEIAGFDVVYKWAPGGNSTARNFKFQAEFFTRAEDGDVRIDEAVPETSTLDGRQSGWYLQGVYQFIPRWRAGLRYDQLDVDNEGSDPGVLAEAGFNDEGHTPRRYSAMVDYTYSEFSRFRLQYNRDESYPDADNQVFLQYIVSIGAHGAHRF